MLMYVHLFNGLGMRYILTTAIEVCGVGIFPLAIVYYHKSREIILNIHPIFER